MTQATEPRPTTQTLTYDDAIVRRFVFASVGWGVVGMLIGAFIALQLAFWPANVEPYLTFGRLRPLHTNAVIFAFVGNMVFAGIYYSTQRLLKVPLQSRLLGKIHFWGWQAIIVSAALTLPLGFTQGKEYAELEWPIDIAIAVVWVIFAINFFWMLAKRNEKHLYVALWFYIATIVTVAMLHIVNSLAIPVGVLKSYSIFPGVQDALVQWWYAHNAVAFFLTTPVLGIMYYFLPKAAERPVFSYRLSIIHFWALVFLYIWAGPHHLLNTAVPDWAQSLGMVFSLMLWAPSWGGMLNGLLTLRGAWHKLRTDPVLKFFAAGITFYGMSTFEGPLLSIKAVSGIAHYTDWIIAHVHGGAMGWNGFLAAGLFYWLVPRLYGTELRSRSAANWHFWIGTIGILLYVLSMWVAGITQGMMWRAENADGGLAYPNFVETVLKLRLLYWARLVGGLLYITGFVVMLWNLVATARQGKAVDGTVTIAAPARVLERIAEPGWRSLVFAPPVVVGVIVTGLLVAIGLANPLAAAAFIFVVFFLIVGVIMAAQLGRDDSKPTWHRLLEGRALIFTVLATLSVLAGGIAEIVPVVIAGDTTLAAKGIRPYTALELEGRDVYLREGCYTCHSQMVRPFLWETARFGEVSDAAESAYDHPFQWGSRRIGPDLARLGGRYSDDWHYHHMMDPRLVTPGSIMPAYPHLADERVDLDDTSGKLRAMRAVGVPYSAAEIEGARRDAEAQAAVIVASIDERAGVKLAPDSRMVALIAYLQRLGVKAAPPVAPDAAPAGTAAPTSPAGTPAPTTPPNPGAK